MKSFARLICLVALMPAFLAACDDDSVPPADAGRDTRPTDTFRPPDAVDAGDTRPATDATDAADTALDTRTDTALDTRTDTPAPVDVPVDQAPVDQAPVDQGTPTDTPVDQGGHQHDTAPVDTGADTASPDTTTDTASPDVSADAIVLDALPLPDAGTGEQVFVATLTGAEENPAVATTARGTATFLLNAAKTQLQYTLRHDVANTTAAHLHTGFAGVNGGIAVGISPAGPDVSGTLTLDAQQAADLEAGKIYVNVHSSANPSGEIRGQLVRPGETVFVANLTSGQEVPAVVSTATGGASFILNAAKTELRYNLRHNVSGATVAHLHTAFAGEAGAVAVDITPLAADTSGTLTLNSTQVTNLEAGRLYVNVHSSTYPSGEIRGQLVYPGETVFVAALKGSEEVPAVTTTAAGTASLLLNFLKTELRYSLRHNVSNATAAHLHSAAPGENGGIAVGISPLSTESTGTMTLTQTQATDLQAGKTYVNVHSSANPSGEIRGQVVRPGDVIYVAPLTGNQETPSVTTSATGTASLILAGDRTSVRYRVSTTGLTPTNAHIHKAMAKVAGPVVHGFTPIAATMEGTQAVSAGDVTDLEAGLWYVNVHTAANPSGEIRGQLVQPGARVFVAALSGAQEVPAVSTTNTGNGMVVLSPAADRLQYHLTSTVNPTVAHFHRAPAGLSGSVEIPIPAAGASMSGTHTPTSTQVSDLLRGLLYFNVHSTANPGGEVRGQIVGIGETVYSAILTGGEEVPPVTTSAGGGIGFILNAEGTELRYDGTVADLTPTAAHIHTGAAGATGPVLYPLSYTGTTLSGTQAISASDRTALDAAGLYANVHTTANSAGEIRGQILKR